jgi:hypothetical protein
MEPGGTTQRPAETVVEPYRKFGEIAAEMCGKKDIQPWVDWIRGADVSIQTVPVSVEIKPKR